MLNRWPNIGPARSSPRQKPHERDGGPCVIFVDALWRHSPVCTPAKLSLLSLRTAFELPGSEKLCRPNVVQRCHRTWHLKVGD